MGSAGSFARLASPLPTPGPDLPSCTRPTPPSGLSDGGFEGVC